MKEDYLKKIEELRTLTNEFNKLTDQTLDSLEEVYKVTELSSLESVINSWKEHLHERLRLQKQMLADVNSLKPNKN